MYKKILYLFVAFLFFCCIHNVSADNSVKILRKTKSNLTSLIDVDKESSKYRNYIRSINTAQSMTVTDKYILVDLVKDASETKNNNNYLAVYSKKDYSFLGIVNMGKGCAHANGLTYDSKRGKLICAAYTNKSFVVYNAADIKCDKSVCNMNTHINIEKVVTSYFPFNNIAYDSSSDAFWVATDLVGYKNFPNSFRLVKIPATDIYGKSNLTKDMFNSYTKLLNELENYNLGKFKFLVNQDVIYKDGRLFLINFINNDNVDFFKKAINDIHIGDAIILSYDLTTGSKGNIQIIKGFDSYELEDVAFDGDKPYLLFQRNGNFRIFTFNFDGKSVNASVSISAKSNNDNLLKNSGMSAKFVSTSNNFDLNKTVDYSNGKYILKSIKLNKLGKFNLKITQNIKSLTNWSLDKGTIDATIKVKYDFNEDKYYYRLIYNKNGSNAVKDSFTNKYTFQKISVPLVIKAPLSAVNNVNYKLNLKASLFKGTSKVEQVELKNNKYSFNNLSFNEPGVYNYTIKQENSGIKKDGIFTSVIDTSVINVKIIVAVDGDKLKYSISYGNKSSFNNKLSVKYNTVNVSSSIPIITNKSNNNIVTPLTKLKVYKSNGSYIKDVNSSNGKYNFNISISAPGTYRYKLVQEDISNNNKYKYNIDSRQVDLKIVAKVVDNQLTCTSTLEKKVSFINKIAYNSINISLSVPIVSSVGTGIQIPTTNAVFTDSSTTKIIESMNDAYNQNVSIDKPGVYKYYFKQLNLTNNNFYYSIDSNKVEATVNVEDTGKQLEYSVTYNPSSFSNTYRTYNNSNLRFDVPINTIKNEINVDDPIMTAYLYNSNNELIGTSSSKYLYEFSNIEVSLPGTYTYRIVQNNTIPDLGNNIDFILDTKEIIVTVIVSNDGSVNISYSADGFSNTINVSYVETTATPKVYLSNQVSDSIVVSNLLGASIYDENNQKVGSAVINGDEYDFSIPVSSPGLRNYSIKQDNAGVQNTDDQVNFIDDDSIDITIDTVYDDNQLKPNIDYKLSSQTFSNIFLKKGNELIVPITASIVNSLSSNKINVPITTAVLSELDEDGNYVEIERVNNSGDSYNFSSLLFSDEGIYTYRITQLNNGYSHNDLYDSYISDVENYIIINVSKNSDDKLSYTIDGDNSPFENVYEVLYDPINVSLSVNINDNNISLCNSLPNRVVLTDSLQVISSKLIDSSSITFDDVEINKEGEYLYNIYQIKPHNYYSDGYDHSFDTSVIGVRVVVVANDNNQLTYTAYYNDSLDIQTLSNTHNSSSNEGTNITNIPISINIFSNSKKMKEFKTKATIFENGLPVETVLSDNEGYDFSNINISDAGSYVFTVRQVPVNDDDIYIDDSVITINVEAYYDGGVLKYNISYLDNDSFSNIDLLALYTEDDENFIDNGENPMGVVIIDNVPFTSLFKGKAAIIFGSLLIIGGYFMIRYYKKRIIVEKEIQNNK